MIMNKSFDNKYNKYNIKYIQKKDLSKKKYSSNFMTYFLTLNQLLSNQNKSLLLRLFSVNFVFKSSI